MSIKERIKQQLDGHKIVLYMKGTAIFPQCGFSAQAMGILKKHLNADTSGVSDKDVLYVNVLEDPEIRQGIKEYGQWPTIPQLYVNGQLVGGSDIMKELDDRGELGEIIQG